MRHSFQSVSACESNPKWNSIISRNNPLYSRNNDIRSEFERDYTRVIHSNAYRRLKHKTQVFFSPQNDHICTRIEHVNHVESISYTIANYLGLNTELTKAISVAHDLGHSPFGHKGERVLSEISQQDLGVPFWHEKNGLFLVDSVELLEDNYGCKQNLDLPYTWEGCVVKIADKISYIGRDIEDAITLGILDEHLKELYELLGITSEDNIKINNTVLMNNLIYDLCENSSIENGLCFSEEALVLMNKIKSFNYKNIYLCDRILPSDRYATLVLNEIYQTFKSAYNANNTIDSLNQLRKFYPNVIQGFIEWLYQYISCDNRENLKNPVLFNLQNEFDYSKAIITYISGMTDKFAIDTYNEIVGF